MKQRLPKWLLPATLFILGAFLLFIGFHKLVQGYSSIVSLNPTNAVEISNPEIDAELPSKTDSLMASQDSGALLEKIIQNKFKGIVQKNKETSANALYPARPESGENFGTLTIPALKLSFPIYEGTNEQTLEKGVGHYTESVLPGEKDNCVLSGHRDTVFSDLGDLKKGDELIVRTSSGTFTYRINKIRIVGKEDTTVIVPKPQATLTLTTCYPFTYIGSAPERYILSAYLITDKQ